MYELLSSFVNEISQSKLLAQLVGDKELDVCVIGEEGQWLIHISKDKLDLQSYEGDKENIVVIKGNNEALRLLLNGDDFLLSMKKRGELEVTGNLKELLLLESIFYLSKTMSKNS